MILMLRYGSKGGKKEDEETNQRYVTMVESLTDKVTWMRMKPGTCAEAWNTAIRHGNEIWVSDKPIDGWWPVRYNEQHKDYLYDRIKDDPDGTTFYGHIYPSVRNSGFNPEGHMVWVAGPTGFEKVLALRDFKSYFEIRDSKEKVDKYLEEKAKQEVKPTPEEPVEKKG